MSLNRHFLSNWQNIIALLLIGVYAVVAIAAPWLAPQDDPESPTPFRRLSGFRVTSLRQPRPPSSAAMLGTAPGGWDIFYSLVWGVRPALRFGLITAFGSATFGVLLGAVSGYWEGALNRVIMRITDAFLTFPAIAGIYLFRQVLPTASSDTASLTIIQTILYAVIQDPVMVSLIVFSWMPYARLINANIIRLKQTEYAMAAITVGARPQRIILRHLLPNALAPAIVLLARDVGGMVILEAAFTFIGIGSGLPWGMLLVAGRDWILGPGGNPLVYWWVFVPTTLALVFFSIGWNLLGDGLNTVLNPQQAKKVGFVKHKT
ncbi:MAG: ABC transporter permease [Anaerolineae bacterium]|nr:ABC transporter permease [Anaerolineae bacterium]